MRADGKRLEHKFNRVELEGGDGTIAGYASVFGAVDLGRDAVERGAFEKSLTARGATGIRILADMAHEMQRRKARYGLETMCIGGGQGMAAVFERAA